jgi:hypothetical protein
MKEHDHGEFFYFFMEMQMRWIYEWNQTCCEWENLNKMGWMHELFKVNMQWNERTKKVTTHQVLSPWARLSHLSWSYLPWLTWWNLWVMQRLSPSLEMWFEFWWRWPLSPILGSSMCFFFPCGSLPEGQKPVIHYPA